LIARIAPSELAAWRADTARPQPMIVDVREPWELERCRIEGSQHVPLRELPARLADLPDDRDLVLVCHHGNRSFQAAMWLSQNGFPHVHNLEGGIDAWARLVEPSMPRY
jgi:rhodanese-related sulfurtransferase